MLQAKHIQKNFGSLTVLADVSFSLANGQKVALVGDNGTGKTTILKIIAGLVEPDAGEVRLAKNTVIGYLPQDTGLTGDETVFAYLRRVAGVDDPEHRIKVMLAGFGLEHIGTDYRLSDLSSGQKSKVALIGILLKDADLLLLDEPTNNLDLPALIWLEDFLQKSEAACIVISHDRRFLDRVVNKIFELDRNKRTLNISGGTYSDYLAMVAKRIARQKEDYRTQQEEIERLTERADKMRLASVAGSKWQGSDNDKFSRGFKRDQAGKSGRKANIIDKRIDQMDKVEKPVEHDPFEIPLMAEVGSGTLDIRLVDVVAGYPDSFTIGPVSFEARYGNRIGIMGLNGTGKSTLLKTITGQLPARGGIVEVGSSVKIGNMMQEHESLPRDQTLFDFLKERTPLMENEIFNQLVKSGFSQSQVKQPISSLSPGGRARLLLALFSAQSVNVLVLDEPTNHLDLEALGALEETIETYKGTILLVSHDRYFLEKARLDTTYVLSDGVLSRISDYRTYVAQAEERATRLLRSL